jgi:hypothetical protein
MKQQTSLGDIISALYDAVDPDNASRPASQVVTACTLDLLLRQRNRRVIAALFDRAEGDLH